MAALALIAALLLNLITLLFSFAADIHTLQLPEGVDSSATATASVSTPVSPEVAMPTPMAVATTSAVPSSMFEQPSFWIYLLRGQVSTIALCAVAISFWAACAYRYLKASDANKGLFSSAGLAVAAFLVPVVNAVGGAAFLVVVAGGIKRHTPARVAAATWWVGVVLYAIGFILFNYLGSLFGGSGEALVNLTGSWRSLWLVHDVLGMAVAGGGALLFWWLRPHLPSAENA